MRRDPNPTVTPRSYLVVLRRDNGRAVKEWHVGSRYAAKRLRRRLESRYDPTYYVDITTVTP